MKASGGIEDDRIEPFSPGLQEAFPADFQRLPGSVMFVYREARAASDSHQLFDRRGAVDVRRNQVRVLALIFQRQTELRGGGGLPGALQSDHHDHTRRPGGVLELPVFGGAEKTFQLVLDDLDDLLAGTQALEDLFPQGFCLDAFHQRLDHADVDVRLQESHPDLPHRLVENRFVDASPAGQGPDHALETFGKPFEHDSPFLPVSCFRFDRTRIIAARTDLNQNPAVRGVTRT